MVTSLPASPSSSASWSGLIIPTVSVALNGSTHTAQLAMVRVLPTRTLVHRTRLRQPPPSLPGQVCGSSADTVALLELPWSGHLRKHLVRHITRAPTRFARCPEHRPPGLGVAPARAG